MKVRRTVERAIQTYSVTVELIIDLLGFFDPTE